MRTHERSVTFLGDADPSAMMHSDVEEFLSRPDSYDPKPEAVERMETHGAIVFLAGDHAYKMKREVRYPLMDFSTLERRHAVCLHELEINRLAAPEIYQDVVAVTRGPDGELAIGGTGEPVEWLVRMKRFSQDDILDAVARRDQFTRSLAERVAHAVAAYHGRADVVSAGAERQQAGDVVAQTQAVLSASPHVRADTAAAFADLAGGMVERNASLLDDRARYGQVRRCHGDLHLRNIVLVDGQVRLFDAIEFNDRVARIDIFYDLAFLLMDLERSGHPEAANWVFNRYLGETGHKMLMSALSALPLFLACRAAVRAMVACWRADQCATDGDADGRGAAAKEAQDYLDRAVAYLTPPAARLVAIGGVSGSGKTTVARELAPHIGARPGAVHLRTDVERKALLGVGETCRLSDDAYGSLVSDLVYGRLLKTAERALRGGHTVVLDGVYLADIRRTQVEQLAQRLGVPFAGLWLCAPPQDMMRRVRQRRGDASDATPEVVARQLARNTGPIRWQALNSKASAEQTIRAAQETVERLLAEAG